MGSGMLAGSLVVALLLLTLNPASGRLRATQTYTVSRTPLDKPQIETHKGFAIGQDSDYRCESEATRATLNRCLASGP